MRIVFLFDDFDDLGNPYNNTLRQSVNGDMTHSVLETNQYETGLAISPISLMCMKYLLQGRGVDIQFIKTTDVVPDHDFLFYWIELCGDAGVALGNNIFSKITKQTKKVLQKFHVTVVIDYSRECPIIRDDSILELKKSGLNIETLNPWHNIRSFIRTQQVFSKCLHIDTVILTSHSSITLTKDLYNEPCSTGITKNSTLRVDSQNIFLWLYRYHLKVIDDSNLQLLFNNTNDSNKVLTTDRGIPAASKKPILALMGTAKLHRAYIFEKLIRTGIYPERANASIFWSGYSGNHTRQLLDYYKKESFDTEQYDFIKLQDINKDYITDTADYNNLRSQDLFIDKNILAESMVSIIGESWIHEPVFTEKTLKAFEWKNIPLIFGGVGLIKILHNYGFKFIPEFDYSYDNYHINDIERVWLFNKEIEKLGNMSNEQIHKLYVDNIDIINHNHQLLRNINLKTVLYELISSLIRNKPDPVTSETNN